MFNPEMKVIGFNVVDVITTSDLCPKNSEAPCVTD